MSTTPLELVLAILVKLITELSTLDNEELELHKELCEEYRQYYDDMSTRIDALIVSYNSMKGDNNE